jgi:hypothetical protein
MLNFSFNLVSNLSRTGKIYLTIYNYINATLLFRRLFRKESREKLFSALDSFWLEHVKTGWYSLSEVKIIIGMAAEALSDYKLTPREVKAIVSYIIDKWDPEVAKAKSVNEELLGVIEAPVSKAVEVYRSINHPLDAVKYVSEVSKVLPDNLSESKLITYVKDTLLP